MIENCIFIIAKQRSGTTLLRRGLSTTNYFYDLNEIFHPDAKDLYWSFLKQEVAQNQNLVLPTKHNQDYLLTKFLTQNQQKVKTEKPFAKLLVDVKYNSFCNNNLVWHSPMQKPYLFQYIKNQKLQVIHLVRNNIFQAYLSEQYALSTNTWHLMSQPSEDRINQKIDININELKYQIEFRQSEINYFRSSLKQLNINHVELAYEDIIDSQKNEFSDRVIKMLKSFFDIDSSNFNPLVATKKVMTNKAIDIISNYQKVQNYLSTINKAEWLL